MYTSNDPLRGRADVLALGADVAVGRLNFALIDGHRRVLATDTCAPSAFAAVIKRFGPDVVLIDSPTAWARTGQTSRAVERELRALGISAYAVPDASRSGHSFYAWILTGLEAFAAAEEAGYPAFVTGSVAGTAVEIFPYGSAFVFFGGRRPNGSSKLRWRRAIVRSLGVEDDSLANVHYVDAALGALTGLRALEGRYRCVGDPGEGVLVLPA